MALTGIEIYKYLPKTNCKKCGFPTCLAFAMKLAQKGVELSACPDVSDEAKKALEAAAKPPIRLVTIGTGERCCHAQLKDPGRCQVVRETPIPAKGSRSRGLAPREPGWRETPRRGDQPASLRPRDLTRW